MPPNHSPTASPQPAIGILLFFRYSSDVCRSPGRNAAAEPWYRVANFRKSGLRAQGSGFDVQGSGFRVQSSRVQGSRVQGSGLRAQGSGLRVQRNWCIFAEELAIDIQYVPFGTYRWPSSRYESAGLDSLTFLNSPSFTNASADGHQLRCILLIDSRRVAVG